MKVTTVVIVLSLAFFSIAAQSSVEPAKIASQPHTINLNHVPAKSLKGSFKGIGDKRAQAIVNYREQHGPYHSVAELARVKGLGKNFVMRHLIELQKVFTVK